MKGSQVYNPYPNSNFLNFDGYTLPFCSINFPNIAHEHCSESQIVANLDFIGLSVAFKIKWACCYQYE